MKKSKKMSTQQCELISLGELAQNAANVANFMQIKIVGKNFSDDF